MKKPAYHYRPAENWVNDPNGLCQADGVYHLFYQYNPGAAVWGDIHWGHAVSQDMIRWETQPIAMAPALEKGEIHCFSGSCCIGYDGVPRVYYTSVGRAEDGRDARFGAQQWMAHASDDMRTLTQTDAYALHAPKDHNGKPVLEWRDPHVIRWKDGYLMALGGLMDGYGCIVAYTSQDGYAWTYRGVMLKSAVRDGVTWECPNLFVIDDRVGVLYSPCGPVEYAVGTLDDAYQLQADYTGVIDPAGQQGFYAPQTFRDARGRQILLGWMPECDGMPAAIAKGWSGCMSLPREIYLNEAGDVRVRLLPEAEEIAHQWQPCTTYPGNTQLTKQGRQSFVRISGSISQTLVLTLETMADGTEHTRLILTPEGQLTLDRSASSLNGNADSVPVVRNVPVQDGCISMFVAFDETTVECCVNDAWLSGRIYPAGEEGTLMLETKDVLTVELCDTLEKVNHRF